jgi:hypothetical protein
MRITDDFNADVKYLEESCCNRTGTTSEKRIPKDCRIFSFSLASMQKS